MYWYQPPPPWFYRYILPPSMPHSYYPPILDPVYLATLMTQYMMYPYYYTLTIEIYKTLLDAWRKTMEAFIKSLEQNRTYKEAE